MKKAMIISAAIPLITLVSCNISVNGFNVDTSFDFEKTNSETLEISGENITGLDVDVSVGKLKISYGDSEKVRIAGSYTCRGINEKKTDAALEKVKIQYNTSGQTLNITMAGEDFNSKFVNLSTDLDITLPKSFADFSVSSDVGDIEIVGLSGGFDISADVGQINCRDISLTGDSKISADVGDIDVTLVETAECELEISADVGDIDLDTQGLDFTVTDKSEDYVSKKKDVLIADKCKAELSADVGDVKINK
ncbi:MAG: DUF4097 family beta strand repeat protein [Ruminococcus sp.]|nr:DUF4097 family beta strand repeat protein [Ruminococcus sp.]